MAKKDNMETIKQDLIEINDRVKQLEGDMDEEVRNYVQHLKEKAREKKEQMQERIAEQPFKSVGIAFGTGVVAGMIVKHFMHKRR